MSMNVINGIHWTERTTEDYVHRLPSDFIAQIENKMDDEEITQKQVAENLGCTPGAVSQVLNSPGNLELKTMVQYARATGMKVAVVVYNDDDPRNTKGPILSEIFSKCWERMGKPEDFFALNDTKSVRGCWVVFTKSATNNRNDTGEKLKFDDSAAADTYAAGSEKERKHA
jgi:predicted transcriptional regulator